MGNDVGKTIGTVVGAAASLIPGVGQLAAVGIMAGTTLLGSGADALADSDKQNKDADRAVDNARKKANEELAKARAARIKELNDMLAKEADEAKIKANMEIENQRIAKIRELEDASKELHGSYVVAKLQIEEAKKVAIKAKEQQEKILIKQLEQVNTIIDCLNVCTSENPEQLSGALQKMDRDFFVLFSQKALSVCNNADNREKIRMILEHEEMRRDVVDNWNIDINNAVSLQVSLRLNV